VRRYDELLVTLATQADRPIGELAVWSAADPAVIEAANDTGTALEHDTVLAAVVARATASPSAPAVIDGDRVVSYGRLMAAARATRDLLRGRGIGEGDIVALLSGRSAELAAAAFGVWLAGATYLPLDPVHPQQRLSHQLADSGAALVLADPSVVLPDGWSSTPFVDVDTVTEEFGDLVAPDPASIGYLIYTSGSTGLPKGTPIRHRALANVVTACARLFDRGSSGVTTAWISTFCFDMSAIEVFMPLTVGGQVVVASDDVRSQGPAMRALLEKHDIKVLQATPTTWREVIGDVAGLLRDRMLITGGEPTPPELARRLANTGAEVWNFYGPTESAIWSTYGRIDPGVTGRPHVGAPLLNTRIFISAPDGRELPVGVRGELCVAGDGVAPGYHDRPELTAERFGEHEEYGWFYRTGDVARWTADGTLDLAGRVDRQIKLRGNRVELPEVEAVLLEHPAVEAAAVVPVGDLASDGRLVAFVRGESVNVQSLWEHAASILPRSVVPQQFISVERFPMTGSDKIDYPALASLAAEHRTEAEAAATPAAEGQVGVLLGLWRELLDRPDLGPEAHFFVEGGHSLLATQLAQRITQDTGIRVKITDVFAHPTPVAMAAAMDAAAADPDRA
jgi:amino acid adenylation domain-containing protein